MELLNKIGLSHLIERIKMLINPKAEKKYVDDKFIESKSEIQETRLKLSEQDIVSFLNKTGIGFYDLFKDLNYINTSITTSNVDTVNNYVEFINTKKLRMIPQTFDLHNNLELNIYDENRFSVNTLENTSTNKIKVLIEPNSVNVGDEFYYKGKTYIVSGIL